MKIRKSITVPNEAYDRYTSLPGEMTLLSTRKHWFTLLSPFLLLVSMTVGISVFLIMASLSFDLGLKLPAVALTILWMSSFLIGGYIFLRWHYHIYLVTTRKIIEIRRFPYLYFSINDVLLDKVRCTEIDISKKGILNSLFDIGDITITFDRPTHREAFILSDIYDPERVGIFLGDKLDALSFDNGNPVWYRYNTSLAGQYRFSEEIFPKYSFRS